MTSALSHLLPGKGDSDDEEQSESKQEDSQGGSESKSDDKGSGGGVKNKHIIEESIYVGVPHRVAYDQWTQYDAWSKIFKKESAKKGKGQDSDGQSGDDDGGDDPDDDRKVTVTAKIGPSQRQWETEIVEQKPGRRIAWRAKGGIQAKGVVTFHRLDTRLTHLSVNIEYKPSGFMETVGNFFRMQRRRVRKDLKLFKNFIDIRGEATDKGPGRVRGEGLKGDVDKQVDAAQAKDKDKDKDQDKNKDGEQGDDQEQ